MFPRASWRARSRSRSQPTKALFNYSAADPTRPRPERLETTSVQRVDYDKGMKPELLEALRQRILENNLEVHEDAIIAQALPAMRLILGAPSSGAVGESRVGGVPDLPLGTVWPRNPEGEAYSFVLQLSLTDVPPFAGNPLPDEGLLYFFVGLDEPASDVDHLVLILDSEQLKPAIQPDEAEFANDAYIAMPAHKLTFELFADMPRWATRDYEALTFDVMTEDENSSYDALAKRKPREIGQLLGYVATVGQDTREDAFVVREVNPKFLYDYAEQAKLDMTLAKRWRNLLRVDSIDELELMIWDAGFFNVLVKDADLERLNFSKLYVAVETS